MLAKMLFRPYEEEPDGEIMKFHHFWIGTAVMLGGWFLWGSDPTGGIVTVIGLLIVADDVIDHYRGGWIRDITERYLGVRMGTPLDFLFRLAMRYKPFRRRYVSIQQRFLEML